jgi:hypothetical protein
MKTQHSQPNTGDFKMKKTVYAALIATAAMFAQVAPAQAISVKNCTGHAIKILIFNQNDKAQTFEKGVITLKNKGTITGLDIRGKNYHHFKIYKRGLLDGHLGTIRGIDENAKYTVLMTNGGVSMQKNRLSCS